MQTEQRLLIVDDNAATRYALRRRMERQGFVVLEADTGTSGLDALAGTLPDALILDVNLPDMTGFDVVRQLRSDPRTALLPVIQVSAASILTGDIVTGLEAGADAYLVHPVDPDVLLATLRTLLRVRDAEQALRDTQARFREIFANVSAPIAVLDAGLRVHECNHAFSQLITDTPADASLDQCFPDEQPAVLDKLREALRVGERWRGTLAMRVSGEERETEWRISPYRTPGLSLVFVEDVTEHRVRERSQERQLADVNTQLAHEVAVREQTEAQLLQAQKMDAIGKLTGGIAHDFNNLLTGIITGLELIKKRFATGRTDKVLDFADAALGSARSAAALTHRLLAFARQQPLDSRPIDVNQHVGSLADLIRRTVGKRIALNLELSTKPVVAVADPGQLESALLNLVINARDALPSGGNIWISSYEAWSNGDARLSAGGYVALSVRDDGVGIEHSVLDKVFDPFFTTKPIGQGTGLGLSMIYGFARQSGGDVTIRSVPGHGTEVTLVLPAAGEPARPPAENLTPDQRGAGEHVLVVEDTDSVRMFVGEVLKDAGYRCTLAADVQAALRHLEEDTSIDLLLTDVGMPQMNGRELASRARQWRPTLPVLFMTGYAENALNRQLFLGEGMELIVKPFQIGELLSHLRHMLETAQ